MRFTHFRIFLFLAAVVACSGQDRGTIMGRVTDPSNAVIAGQIPVPMPQCVPDRSAGAALQFLRAAAGP